MLNNRYCTIQQTEPFPMITICILLWYVSSGCPIAAADNVQLVTSDMMHLDVADNDQSPEGFMKRLKDAESAQGAHLKKRLFRLYSRYKEKSVNQSHTVRSFMQAQGCGDYYDYFVALAKSSLSDAQKIEERFVMIPYFKELQQQPLDVKENAYRECQYSYDNYSYSIGRLLRAAYWRIGIDLNQHWGPTYFMQHTLLKDDIPSLQLVLHLGADPNGGKTLIDCTSRQAAQLLLAYGADFGKQHQQNDLIENLCNDRIDYDDDLLPFFLLYITLHVKNKFGQKWISQFMSNASIRCGNSPYKFSLLLRFGCHYDREEMMHKIDKWDSWCLAKSKEEEKKHTFKTLIEQDRKRRVPIVLGLRNRALTGKSLVPNTNLSACYNRALAMEDKRRNEVSGQMMHYMRGLDLLG